jgi:uncharacterized membrane protein YgcG
MLLLFLVAFLSFSWHSALSALELPPLNDTINDLAGIMPEPSYLDLEKRIKRFKARSGHSVVVITLQSLEDEDLERFG